MEEQRALWPRIVYVDMGAHDAVTPFPLYHRLGERDTLYQISQRYLDVLRLLDNPRQDIALAAAMRSPIFMGRISTTVSMIDT